MKKGLKIYLFLVHVFFLFFSIILYLLAKDPISFLNLLFFITALFFSNNITYLIHSFSETTTSIILPILFPAMLIFDPFWIAVIAFIGTSKLKYRENNFYWYKFLFNRTMFFISAGTAALVFQNTILYFDNLFISFLFSAIIYFIINNGLVFLTIRIAKDKQNISFSYYAQLCKNLLISFLLGLSLNYIYTNYGKFIFILSIAVIYFIKDFIYTNIKQLNSMTQIIESFLKVIDSKDHYTEGHCERVARYTKILCAALGVSKIRTEKIVNIARIHDIGKINIPDNILKSSTGLTKNEYSEVKKHCIYGYQLLNDIDLLKKELNILLYHHEYYDGNGYPEGKKKREIPFGSRILAICDAFDVMTSGRIYKPPMKKEEIIEEIKKCSGKQFDPDMSKKMLELISKGIFDDSFKSLSST